jgi:hypothetical protein
MTTAVRYLQLAPEESNLPDLNGMRPFRAVVLVRETVTNDWRNRVSDWLVAAGCLYVLAWGKDCSVWDDSVDWANIDAFDSKPIPPEHFVMTTWHEDETIEEVFWSATHCAEHPTVALQSDLILDIASANHEVDTIHAWAGALADDA